MSGDMVLVWAWGTQVAIPIGDVARVAQLPAITPVPGDPPSCLGRVRVEDRPLRVDDLGMILGVAPTGRYTVNHTLVVLESGGARAGVVVGPEVDLLPHDAWDAADPLAPDHGAPLAAIISIGTRHLPVLDTADLLRSTAP